MAMASGTMSRTGDPREADREVVVRAVGLTKIFKDFWMRDRARAVDNIDFQIRKGEIFGLLGPNGSGKSTTIKMMLGLLKRSRGRLAVFGKPPSDVSIKERIGYVPEESYLYPFLNARETLDYYGKLFNLSAKVREQRTDELLEMVGLAGVQFRQVREYSKGMQRRIGIAQALINDPEFLILDEPTTGLDPIGTRQIKDLISHLGQRGKTILLSSHLLTDVEDVVDRMVILYGGRIRAEGTCEELLISNTKNVIETDRLDDETIEEVRKVIEGRRHSVLGVTQPRQRLEELFLNIVEQAQQEQAATSGASHGGATASFLVEGEGAAPSGEALIDSLLAPERPGPQIGGSETASPDESVTVEPEPASTMIDDLVAPVSDPVSNEPARVVPRPGQAKPAEIDESVIGSLLDSDDVSSDADDDGDGGRRDAR